MIALGGAEPAMSRDPHVAVEGAIRSRHGSAQIGSEVAGKGVDQMGEKSGDDQEKKEPTLSDRATKTAVTTAVQALVEGRLPAKVIDGSAIVAVHRPAPRDAIRPTELAALQVAKRPTPNAVLKPADGPGRDIPTQTRTTPRIAAGSTVTAAGMVVGAQTPPLMWNAQNQQLTLLQGDVESILGHASIERQVTTGQTLAPVSTPAGAETGRQVAHQIAVAITNQQGRMTEIALNPEELGRVRLSMTVVDSTINLSVLAERPETNDLLRRHIDALAQEFRALGYDNITFSFGEEAQKQRDAEPAPDHSATDSVEQSERPMQTTTQSTTGLDLRL
jgi:hypothetical protein